MSMPPPRRSSLLGSFSRLASFSSNAVAHAAHGGERSDPSAVGVAGFDGILTVQQPNDDSMATTRPGIVRDSIDAPLDQTRHKFKEAAERPHVHWRASGEEFTRVELELRSLNRLSALQRAKESSSVSSALAEAASSNDFFASHSWRNPDTQELKRQLISEISRVTEDLEPGMTYWADFLDLVSNGPVEWRSEIEEGIIDAAKFVAFIDKDYILSYNCLMELSVAMSNNKPILLVLLDNEAWSLLVNPNGPEMAWNESPDLRAHKGSRFAEGRPEFGIETLRKIFAHLNSINFCPCRPSDINVLGIDSVTSTLRVYVRKDINYLKEHSELQRRARQWAAKGRQRNAGSLLSDHDIHHWTEWYETALAYGTMPRPTSIQVDFIKASRKMSNTRKWALRSALLVFVICILTGAAAAGVMAVIARRETRKAEASAQQANEEKVSVLAWNLISKASLPELDSYTALRALKRALELLPDANKQELSYQALDLFRRRLTTSYLSPSYVCTGLVSGYGTITPWMDTAASGMMATVPRSDADGDLLLWNTTDTSSKGALGVTLEGISVSGAAIEWGPPGSDIIATGDATGSVYVWETDPAGDGYLPVASLPNALPDPVWIMDFNRDGTMLAFVPFYFLPFGQVVRIWHFRDPEAEVQLLTGHNAFIIGVDWNPSGNILATHASDKTVFIWEFDDAGVLVGSRLLSNDVRIYGNLAWHPDGTKFAGADIDRIVYVYDIIANTVTPIPKPTSSVSNDLPAFLTWFPESVDPITPLWVGYPEDGNLAGVWKVNVDDAAAATAPSALPETTTPIYRADTACYGVFMSPDQQWVAATFSDGKVILMRAQKTVDTKPFTANVDGEDEETFIGKQKSVYWSDTGVNFVATVNTAPPAAPAGGGWGDFSGGGAAPSDASGGGNGGFSFGPSAPATPPALETRIYTMGWDGNLTFRPIVDSDGPVGVFMYSHTWSSDGLRLAFGDSTGDTIVWSLSHGQDNVTITEAQMFSDGLTKELGKKALSPDGTRLASFTYNIIKVDAFLHDLRTGETQALELTAQWDGQISWSPDGRLLTNGGDVWSVPAGVGPAELAYPVDGSILPSGTGWHPSGNSTAFGYAGGVVQIWNDPGDGGADILTIPSDEDTGEVYALEYSRDGTMLVTGTTTGVISIVLLGNRVPSTEILLEGHSGVVTSTKIYPATSRSGKVRPIVVTSSADNTVRLWDPHAELSSGLRRLYGHQTWVYCVSYSPTGTQLASAGKDGSVMLWHNSSKSDEVSVLDGHSSWVLALEWSPSSSDQSWALASASQDGNIIVHSWEASAQQVLQEVLHGHTMAVTALAWSKDGQMLASGSDDSTAMLWFASSGWASVPLAAHKGAITSVAFSATGPMLAAASMDGTASVWRIPGDPSADAENLHLLQGHAASVSAVAYSTDGVWLATSSADATVRLYRLTDGDSVSLEAVIEDHPAAVTTLAVSPDSRLLASGCKNGAVHLTNLGMNRDMSHSSYHSIHLQGHVGEIRSLSFSPNSEWLGSIAGGPEDDGVVRLWNVSDTMTINNQVLEGHSNARRASVSFSSDSKSVAFAGRDGNAVHAMRLFDVDGARQQLQSLLWGNVTLTQADILKLSLPQQVLDAGITPAKDG